jgi:glycosyltransferase involved in cell wall biosynthesis
MHLAVVTHNVLVGDGQARVNREVVRFALARGHQVTLLADRVEPRLIKEGARWIPLHPLVSEPILFKVPLFAFQADRALAALSPRPDVVVANGVVLWRQRADVNAVHFVHGAWQHSPMHTTDVRRGLNTWYQAVFTYLNALWEQRAFRQAETIVAVSARVKDELVSVGVAPGRVQVIPNGVDVEEFKPGPADRSRLGLPEVVSLALFVGDIKTARKNLGSVLSALVRVPGLHLAVAGALESSPYPALAASLGIEERVHFLGFRRDVADLMRAADFFICPSRYEPFSLVVLEAMATGLPVITARTVGAASLVTPESGFVLDDPEDQAGLVRAMMALTLDRARREQMGVAARAVAEQNTWSTMARSYMDVFSSFSPQASVC